MNKAKKPNKKKIFITVLITLFLIPIIGLILLFTCVNPNSYKSKITSIASNAINREVLIDGDLNWSLFPLGVTLNDFKIANDPKFKPNDMITAKRATLRLELFPLLSGKYHIRYITLKNATINLSKDKDDYTNWQSIFSITDKEAEKTGKLQTPTTDAHNTEAKFSIADIKITNGTINWEDPKEHLKITNINIQGYDIDDSGNKPIHIKGSLDSNFQNKNTKITAKFDLKTTLFENNNIIDNITLDLKEFYLKLGGKTYPQKPEINISGNTNINLTKKTFEFKNIKADLNDLDISGDLNGNYDYKTPGALNLNGKVAVKNGNLQHFFNSLNIAEKQSFYKKISATFIFNTSNKIITVDPINLKLDSDKIDGFIKIDSTNTPYKISTNIKADILNIDKLLGQSDQQKTATEGKPKTTSSPTSQKDNTEIFGSAIRSALQNLNVNILASIKKLTYSQLDITNFDTNVTIRNQKIDSNTKFIVYKGLTNIYSSIDLSKNTPSWNGKFNINNFDIESFLRQKMDSKRWSGSTDITVSYQTLGNKSDELLKNLNGNVKLDLKDGYLNGIDLNAIFTLVNKKLDLTPDRIIDIAKSALSIFIKKPKDTTATDKTRLFSLNATGVISNGTLSNNDLIAVTPFLKATGQGRIYLPGPTINYRVTLSDNNNKSNLDVPIILTGNLFEPNYDVDTAALLNSNLFKTILRKNLKSINNKLLLDKVPMINNVLENL